MKILIGWRADGGSIFRGRCPLNEMDLAASECSGDDKSDATELAEDAATTKECNEDDKIEASTKLDENELDDSGIGEETSGETCGERYDMCVFSFGSGNVYSYLSALWPAIQTTCQAEKFSSVDWKRLFLTSMQRGVVTAPN